MRPGTPGFIGARLREGREARGLSAIALADLAGVSRQAISRYEAGDATPHPDVMDRIATALNLPIAFFLRPLSPGSAPTIFYRSMSAATKVARSRGERRFGWLRELTSYLQQFIAFPTPHLPDVGAPIDPTSLSDDEIDEAAARIRSEWHLGVGPVSNLVWAMEHHGVVVARDELGAATLDAFSAWDGETPYAVLGTDKGSAVRSRLDAAHELGHLVLHRGVDRARLVRPVDHRLVEDQAFRFARALLLPATSFAGDLYVPSLEALRALKRKWSVSIGAMIIRAEELQLMTPEHTRRLWIAYNRRGWRRNEPFDDELPVENPRLLRLAIEMTVNEAGVPRTGLAVALTLQPADIEMLANLTPGYLSDRPPMVRVLSPRTTCSEAGEPGPGAPPPGGGQVVDFRRKRNQG